MRVAYEVHHISDRLGYLYDVLRGGYSEILGNSKGEPPPFARRSARRPTASVSWSARGRSSSTRTFASHQDRHNAPTVHLLNGPATGACLPRHRRAERQLHPGVRSGVRGTDRDRDRRRCRSGTDTARAIRAVIAEISEVAAEVAEAPILSIQSPVQLPATTGFDQDVLEHEPEWPRSSSLAVRFSIGLDRPSAELRLRIADAFAEFCVERGFGLWLADLRPGLPDRQLVRDLPPRREVGPSAVRRRPRRGHHRGVSACLPVTLVGPARVGSTHAILRVCSPTFRRSASWRVPGPSSMTSPSCTSS